MPTPTEYIKRIEFADRIIKMRTEGLTHADSMKQLPFPANCMNWNLGHLMVYRDQYLGVIDGLSQADPEEFKLYGAGSDPLTDSEKALPLEMILERLETASERLKAAFIALPPDQLDESFESFAGETINDYLHFYAVVHEALHLGQLEILRELALS
ncbi:MAG: DinB family protein, partial [Chloroflexota bacterium]